MDKLMLPCGLEFEYSSGYPEKDYEDYLEKSINTFKKNPVEIIITGNLESFTLSSIYDR